MTDSRPRDLTEEELALIRAPAGRGLEAAPLRVPPGTAVAVEFLGAAGESPAAAPTASAPTESGGAPSAPLPRSSPRAKGSRAS